MTCFQCVQIRIRRSRSKRAISNRATEERLFFSFHTSHLLLHVSSMYCTKTKNKEVGSGK